MAYSYPQNGPLYPSDFALMYGGPPWFEPTGPPTYDGMVAQREPTPAPQPEARAHTQSRGYLFPSDHTHINFILPTHAHSSSPNLVQDPSRQFDYTTMMIPTCMTIKELIHKLGANNGKEKHNGIQEIWPIQNKPGWKAGITRWANEPNAEKTIKAIGLDETRGADGGNSTAWIRVLRSRDQ